MRTSRIVAAVVLAYLVLPIVGQPKGHAGYISNLYNTGTNASNTTIAGGSNNTTPDSHYLITSVVGSTPSSSTTYITNPNSYPLGSSSSWVADDAVGTKNGSEWISANGNVNGSTSDANGNYLYSTTFNDSSAAGSFITGKISADDQVSLYLNGHLEFTTTNGYGAFTNFTINNGDFVTGTNALTFAVNNIYNGPEGLRFQATSASVPEPASLAMLGLGLGIAGVGAARRHRKQSSATV